MSFEYYRMTSPATLYNDRNRKSTIISNWPRDIKRLHERLRYATNSKGAGRDRLLKRLPLNAEVTRDVGSMLISVR